MGNVTKELTVFVSDTGRRYIDAADIATTCGVPQIGLDNVYRPSSWGAPREFRWDGRRLWYAEESLPALADSLDRGGQHDAAILLRDWLAAHLVRVAEQERAAAPERSKPDGQDWMSRWEADHT